MQPDRQQIERFQTIVWTYFESAGRHDLPWRLPAADGAFDPYAIMVSELMLQQTQVQRVIPKFEMFMERFPTVRHLADASLGDVLVAWQGLGYNRRAKYLWQAADMVAALPGSRFPTDVSGLVALPGVGTNTAGAIMVYAYDQPVAFIETNIRSVFIHHFFTDSTAVHDRELLPVVESALPPPGAAPGRVRRWYWALMDYGTHLKKTTGNAARLSTSYAKQSAFAGSRRQVRGAVLRALADGPILMDALENKVGDPRLSDVLDDLGRERLIMRRGNRVELYDR